MNKEAINILTILGTGSLKCYTLDREIFKWFRQLSINVTASLNRADH